MCNLAALVLLLATARSAFAANSVLYWDADTGTSGAQDGPGTWDADTTVNWWNGLALADVAWANASGGTTTAIIGATNAAGGTITVDGTLAVNTISFASNSLGGNYTLSGGTLNMSGSSPTIAFVNVNLSPTINSVIGEASAGTSVTFGGPAARGTMTLGGGGNNTFSGNAILGTATVNFDNLQNGGVPSSFGQGDNTRAVVVGNNASFSTANYTGTGGSTDRPWTVNGTGGGNINNNGYGPISFNNTGSAIGGSPAGNRGLGLGGIYTATANTFAGSLTNMTGKSTTLTVSGGIWNILGTNSHSSTVLSGGTLQLTNEIALGTPSSTNIVFTGNATLAAINLGAPERNDVTISSSRTMTVNSGKTASFKTPDTNNLIVGAYITGPGSVGKSATSYALGTVRFSNDTNDYTGEFSVGYGSSEFTSVANQGTASSLGKGTTGIITINNSQSSGTLTYVGTNNSSTTRPLNWIGHGGYSLGNNGSGTIAWLSSANLRSADTASTTFTLQGSNTGINTFAQVINDNSGVTSLTKIGTGKWVLTGANTYSGATAIQQGTLVVNSLNSVSSGAASSSLGAPTTVASGTIGLGNTWKTGILNHAGPGETSDRVIDLAGTTGGATLAQSGSGLLKFTSDLTASGAGAKTLTLDGSTAGTGEIAGIIPDSSGGATALAKTGTGTWTLSGANTYSGNTTIAAGTLALTGSGSIGTGANLIINAAGTFDVSALGGGCTLSAAQILMATNGATAAIKGSLDVASAAVVMSNVINTATLNVTGGALTLGSGMPFTVDVNNGGTPLGGGSYKLIAKGSGGSVGGTAPAAVTVGGDGLASGATASLNISGGELFLVVSGGTLALPTISGFTVSGGQAVLSFSGPSGQTWEVVTSANVAAPLSGWTVVASGTFSGSTVYYTNSAPTDAHRFYTVKSP